ncbi:MAG: hypothetical protein A4E37_02212 [Methanoregulaceae archaeon PtaB.Bin056]|jgi:signal transduction histidine kinase|nr:MAG: hypothetical protein A4E37_02212 [Methanoregulaceae archaeon PtaB.Bin056]
MEEKRGRFVQGAWVEASSDQVEQREEVNTEPIDQRIDQVSAMVTKSLSEVIGLVRDLVTTPEGHAHIERQVNQAVSQIERAISDVLKPDPDENSEKAGEEKKKIPIK